MAYCTEYQTSLIGALLLASDGAALTGFGGGIDTKVKLLELELSQAGAQRFTRPVKGTALEGVACAADAWRLP